MPASALDMHVRTGTPCTCERARTPHTHVQIIVISRYSTVKASDRHGKAGPARGWAARAAVERASTGRDIYRVGTGETEAWLKASGGHCSKGREAKVKGQHARPPAGHVL